MTDIVERLRNAMRFMAVLTKFILTERKPPQILEDIAWYCPPTDTRSHA